MKRALPFAMALAVSAGPAAAQRITIRTVPVSQAHQFQIYPSHTLAMGGVSIAVDDTLLDPFSNPGAGARLAEGRVFSVPGLYSVSSGAGAGRTLTAGALTRSGAWFGGLSVSLQEVDLSDLADVPISPLFCPTCRSQGVDFGPPQLSHGNTHAFALVGRDLTGDGLSLGGSLSWSGLSAVDGTDLLYANSARVDQRGDALDLRLGLLKAWEDSASLQAVALRSSYDMTHDVVYLDQYWDPGMQQVMSRPRTEANLDRTTTWGLHVEYERPLAANGWRVGGLATVNRASHPKIPNYELMNIPRDPGNSSAFNVGVGLSRAGKGSTFAVDLVYEPIWSHTWADSEDPVLTVLGDTIAPGGMTIENTFRFSNAHVRMGIEQEFGLGDAGRVGGLQLGLAVQTISYRLRQQNHVENTSRRQREEWAEWTPTWGLRVSFPALEIRYRGAVTSGTGRPGVFAGGGGLAVPDALASGAGNILLAPSGPLTLTDVTVTAHQVSVSLPLR